MLFSFPPKTPFLVYKKVSLARIHCRTLLDHSVGPLFVFPLLVNPISPPPPLIPPIFFFPKTLSLFAPPVLREGLRFLWTFLGSFMASLMEFSPHPTPPFPPLWPSFYGPNPPSSMIRAMGVVTFTRSFAERSLTFLAFSPFRPAVLFFPPFCSFFWGFFPSKGLWPDTTGFRVRAPTFAVTPKASPPLMFLESFFFPLSVSPYTYWRRFY